jgi:hypothetical protein
MTGNQASHITVTCRDGGDEITSVYAVNEDISRELDQRIKKPTGKDLQAWLETKGCRLDCPAEPAFVRRTADGSTEECYYRNGKQHREGGPAFVKRTADGGAVEAYYRDGKQHREDGPAIVKRYADGATCEEYFRDGKLHREDGPAYVWHNINGRAVERYYRDGKLHDDGG